MNNKNLKYILLGAIALVALFLVVRLFTPQAGAYNGYFNPPQFNICNILPWLPQCEEEEEDQITICHRTESEQNPWVEITIDENALDTHLEHGDFIVDEENPCPPEEEEEEPTPTPTPPQECEEDCEEPTPTETPVVCTENCGNPPTFQGSTTNPPAPPTCTVPFEVARTWYGDAEFRWATDAQGIQKFSIVYGPTADQMIYGVDNLPSDSRSLTINRPNWNQTWFSVYTWVGDCANQSTPIDP